jgi:hypothetical protein
MVVEVEKFSYQGRILLHNSLGNGSPDLRWALAEDEDVLGHESDISVPVVEVTSMDLV